MFFSVRYIGGGRPPGSSRSWLAGLLVLAACGGNAPGQYVGDIVTRTDFEDLAGWGTDVSGLSSARAHSGSRSIFAGPDREYSLTYKLPLGQASVHPLKALDVSAWVYLPSAQAGATLVVQVFAPGGGRALFDTNVRLPDLVHEYGRWQPVQHTYVLPPGLPQDAELRLFLWRGSSPEPVYLDDLTVKARE